MLGRLLALGAIGVLLSGCISTYKGALERPVIQSRVIASPVDRVEACVAMSREFSNQPMFGGPIRPARTVVPATGAIVYSAYLPGWVGMRSNVMQQALLYAQPNGSTRIDVSAFDPAFGDGSLPAAFWTSLEACVGERR